MPKEIHATTNDVKISKRVITAPPAPQTVRVYAKDGSHHQDVFPVDAKEIVAGGDYTLDPSAVVPTGENVHRPIRPETLGAILPEATVPLADLAPVEEDDDPNLKLRGALPDDFPSRSHLDTAGYGTYAKVRKLVAKGEGWWKDVNGIGEKSYGAVEDALKEK